MPVRDMLDLKGGRISSIGPGAPSDSVDHMRSVMTHNHVRHLPIRDDGRLPGVLSCHDVAKAVLRAASFANRRPRQYIRNWPEPEKS